MHAPAGKQKGAAGAPAHYWRGAAQGLAAEALVAGFLALGRPAALG